MIKVYAFDFDGVISDSAKGWAFFCNEAWKKLGNKPLSVAEIEKYRPYIKDAADSFAIMCLISSKSKVTRDNIKKIIEKRMGEAQEFRKIFFNGKKDLLKRNSSKLADLYGPYEFILAVMKKMNKKSYIVTNNEKASILPTLKKYKIPIKEPNILDSTITHDKKELIKIICERESVKPENIFFIEDSIEHIKDVIKTGVNVALASWGYVLDDDIKEAKRLGVRILDRKDINQLLDTTFYEYFDVVDKNDNIIGRAPRGEVHRKGLLHRAIYVIVTNSKGEILLQKRSMTKDLHPGLWTTSVSGHVDPGENYEQAAKRETMEEIGLKTELKEAFTFFFRDTSVKGRDDNEIKKIYFAKNNGPFEPNAEEVAALKFFSLSKTLEMTKNGKLTPPSADVIMRIAGNGELLKRLQKL